MKRHQRLRSARDFAAVRLQGQAVHSRTLTLSWLLHTTGATRVGIITGKRVGHATVRNLVKRRLRVLLHQRYAAFPAACDIVVIAKAGSADLSYTALEQDLDKLISRTRWHRSSSAASRQADVPPRQPTASLDLVERGEEGQP